MPTPPSNLALGLEGQIPAPFDPAQLTRSVITAPLKEALERGEQERHSIVIDVNVNYLGGREGAWTRLRELLFQAMPGVRDASNEKGPQEQGGRWIRRHFQQYIVVSGITTQELR